LAPATTTTVLKDRGTWKWGLWDRLEVKEGDITLKEFLDLFMERFGLEISMLSYGPSMLYYNFGGVLKKDVKERLKLPITQVIEKVAKVKLRPKEKYIVLEAVVANEDGEETEIPYIRLKIR